MYNLIKNELYKIFHKKSTYVVLIIIFLFTILVNYIYTHELYTDYYTVDKDYINELEIDVKNLEDNGGNLEDIVFKKTELDTQKLCLKYKDDMWKVNAIETFYYDDLTSYYEALIINNNKIEANKIKLKLDEMQKNLKEDNWIYFANLKLKEDENYLNSLKVSRSLEQSEIKLEEINYNIKIMEEKVNLDKYRIDKKIGYESYLADAIDTAYDSYESVIQYNNAKNDKEKEEFKAGYKAYYESKYILDKKIDTNNEQSIRGVIKNLYTEFEFFIIVFVIMISGAIVSDEFNKGTIKNLLTVPKTRKKILLAKYLSVLLLIPFIVLFIFISEMIIGGLFFGYSSLSIPVINYIIDSNTMSVMHVFTYFIVTFVTKLPIVILLATLAFALSTIINNTAISIAITICGYIASTIINQLAYAFNIKILNYFVTTNWDFSVYLFGESSMFNNSVIHAIIICVVYYLIMIVTSFIIFKRKNIKNI